MAVHPPPATGKVSTPVSGTCFIPDVFLPALSQIVTALDWARVHNTHQRPAMSARELESAARAARDLAEQCEQYAADARELDKAGA